MPRSPVNGQSGITPESDNEQLSEEPIASEPSKEESEKESSNEPSEESSEESSVDASNDISRETSNISDECDSIISKMSLFEKVCQMFIIRQDKLVGISKVTVSDSKTKEAIEKHPIGGVIYFAPNIKTPEQCKEMITGIQSYSKIPLFISVDEEGGSVARLGNNEEMGTSKFPDMCKIPTEEDAYNVGFTIGNDIKQFGFNLDFAPVADVNLNPNNKVIGKRAFSSDPKAAALLVEACVKGFKDSGVLCTLKHFPGHGDTINDSHTDFTKLDKTLNELEEAEFLPFIAGINANADMVMMGHIALPEITGNSIPASLSKEIVSILRDGLNYSGVIITDSMSMDSITDYYTSPQAAVMAIEAGIDIILLPNNFEKAIDGVLDALENGVLTEERINESVRRIIELKLRSGIIQ